MRKYVEKYIQFQSYVMAFVGESVYFSILFNDLHLGICGFSNSKLYTWLNLFSILYNDLHLSFRSFFHSNIRIYICYHD